MRISDWSSDVCSSDLWFARMARIAATGERPETQLFEGEMALIGRMQAAASLDRWLSVWEKVTRLDRKSVVSGKSVSVRVDLGGRRIIKKKTYKSNNQLTSTNY